MPEGLAPSRAGRATLAVVAASAGVSIATVSKVVNGRTDVAPATRALVQQLLEQHDYVARRADPTRSAPLTTASQPTIELLFRDDLNSYGLEVLQGIVDAGAAVGVGVIVSRRSNTSESGATRSAKWVNDLVANRRTAVISVVDELTAADVKALARARLPLVVIDPTNQPRVHTTSVGSTNFAGGLTATQHLISLGHRKIAYVGGPVTAACNQARMHGYRAAMEAVGAPVPAGYTRIGDFLYHDGITQGAALLELPDPPTAVFAGSDEMALGVMEAARSRGLRVPEDLSVVGFDDTQVARMASPPLTTIRQPLREMGAVALRTAMRLAASEELDSHHVELATQLVERRSTMRLEPRTPAT